MPAQLRDRSADNWRPLIAIADAFGADWAALSWSFQHQDEDAAVVLLRDIRDIFKGLGVDRLSSKAMVAARISGGRTAEPAPQYMQNHQADLRGRESHPRCLAPVGPP